MSIEQGGFRVETLCRVTLYPAHVGFRYPVRPEFAYTIEWNKGPVNYLLTESIETNAVANCIHARSLYIPHNNKVTGETDPTWGSGEPGYNTSLPSVTWTKLSAGTRIKFAGDHFLTPWVKNIAGRERQQAIFYGFLISDPGTPGTRYDYSPSTATLKLYSPRLTDTREGMTGTRCQGFYMRLGVQLDAMTEEWSGGSGTWAATYTFPANSDDRPEYTVAIEVGPISGDGQDNFFHIRMPFVGHTEVWTGSDLETKTEKIQDYRSGSTLGNVMGAASQGYFGYLGHQDESDNVGEMWDVRLIGGLLQISRQGHAAHVTIPCQDRLPANDPDEPNGPYCYIKRVQINVVGMRSLILALSPHKYLTDAQIVSKPITVGTAIYESDDDPVMMQRWAFGDDMNGLNVIDGAGAETTITRVGSDDISNSEVKLTTDFTGISQGTYNGQDYCQTTAMLRATTFMYPEVMNPQVGFGVEVYPESVTVSQQTNLDDLNVTSQAALVFNNFSTIANHIDGAPDMFWGEWANLHGQVAGSVEFKTNLYYYGLDTFWNASREEFYGTTGWVPVFSGYFNTQNTTTFGTGAQSKFMMQGQGREIQMQTEFWNIPWLDGWNHYFAAAHLANKCHVYRGTVGDSDLAFRPYVGDTPDVDLGDPDGNPSYFLPQGSGGSPLMKFAGGEQPWTIFTRLCKQAGYIRYFDAYGVFHYEKFDLASTSTPFRVFSLRDGILDGFSPAPNTAIMGGAVTRDYTQVRNDVSVIGLDVFGPLLNPIVAHRHDEASISSSALSIFDTEAPNYVGWLKPLVWVDSMFANAAFASDAADRAYALSRLPYMTSTISTWLQADFYPGLRYGINDWRSGSVSRDGTYLEWLALIVNHTWSTTKAATSTIVGRWVPPLS